MAKGKDTKKKNWKLRRQLRKTLGCLFMISAIIVTTIPVQPIEAAGEGWDTADPTKWWQKAGTRTAADNTSADGVIPYLNPSNTIVYQTEDGVFQFAYVDEKGSSTDISTNKFAIIVGYLKTQNLPGGNLTIPSQVDAYVKYTDTMGSTGGYAAANKLGKPLYYKTTMAQSFTVMSDPVLQTDMTYAQEEIVQATSVFAGFSPCSGATKGIWSPNGNDVALYYYNNPTGIPPAGAVTKDETEDTNWTLISDTGGNGRIRDANVSYIGNQYATDVGSGSGSGWKIAEMSSPSLSVFGGTGEGRFAGNITNLTLNSNLLGIGNYAFYNCQNIRSVTFGNGLNTIGNGAFANCGNLVSANMPFNAMLDTIGARAFYNCGSLQTFSVPTVTRVIGDSAFENCTSLKTIDLIIKEGGVEMASSLKAIGYKAFKNCSSLQYLKLPKGYDGLGYDSGYSGSDKELQHAASVFYLSTVQGCRSLQYISTPSDKINFVTDEGTTGIVDGTYGFNAFKNDVGDSFYIENYGYVPETNDRANNRPKTPSHKTANVQEIAFKYYGEDIYEIVKRSQGYETSDGVKGNSIPIGLVYAVDSGGNLIIFRVEDENGNIITAESGADGKIKGVAVPELTMPERIGPYGIQTIAYGSFNDNCWVEKVTIPGSVKRINNDAFKGSHNLKHVIFTNAENIESIGKDAFATQKIRTAAPTHENGGQNGFSCKSDAFLDVTTAPFLSFSGTIENEKGINTEPFKYAMNSGARINEGRQLITYITYYSGFPSNLTVRYNPDEKVKAAELIAFPTKAEVESGYKNGIVNPGGSVSGNNPGAGEYLYPYITDSISAEAKAAFSSGNPTENQVNIKNSVYHILIPKGVTAIKEGLFSGLDTNGYVLGEGKTPEEYDKTVADTEKFASPSVDIQSITVKSVNNIPSYAFARMPELLRASVGGASTIGSYAFDKSKKLASADIGPDTSALGLRPFSDCTGLTDVTFTDSPYFAYDNGVIYGLTNGTKTKIMQVLPSRGNLVGSGMVGPDEFIGIKEIEKEAFMNCDDIGEVDLSKSSVGEIPEKSFAESDRLYKVILPDSARAIRNGAFWNTPTLKFVQIPNSVQQIALNAFAFTPRADGTGIYGEEFQKDRPKLEFICLPDSNAALYAEDHSYIGWTTSNDLKVKWSVMFFDASNEKDIKLIKEERIVHGENAELPTPPDHTADGLVFERWSPSETIFNPVTQDREVLALYKPKDVTTHTVRFFNYAKKEMTDFTQQVVEGKDAVPPSADKMAVDGMIFTGWDRSYENITAPIDIYATYTAREAGKFTVTFWTDTDMTKMIGNPQQVEPGKSAVEPAHPKKEGHTFSGWYPATSWQNVTKDLDVVAMYTVGGADGGDDNNNGNNGNNNGNNNNGNNNNGNNNGNNNNNDKDSVSSNSTKYKVTVSGGSGSGDYTPGTIVNINAYATADGKVFDKWTSSSAGVGFVNASAISTTFTMPSNNVDITANLKDGGGSSTVTGNSRNPLRNSTTTVDITKGGISNSDIASANVNGSSDDYVIKITEDAQATAAVIAALEAKYGDLSNIAYLPMDISLYDSTGQTKITDVSGISVDITLPLPDELIQYAGNNRAASVLNGELEELGAKFTTIDGIPCIQFTATHFSPYTIYVDKGNLTEGLLDATPKTGDPIHPKWFLAMGLACISIILFAKKDKGMPRVKSA